MSILTIEIDEHTLEVLSRAAAAAQSTVDEKAKAVLKDYAIRQLSLDRDELSKAEREAYEQLQSTRPKADVDRAMSVLEDIRTRVSTAGQKFTREELNARGLS